jgi:hypothetical protein
MQVFVSTIMTKSDARSEGPDLNYQGVFTSVAKAAEGLVLNIYNESEYFCEIEDTETETRSQSQSTNGDVITITTTKTITRTDPLTEEIVDEIIDGIKNSETEGEVRGLLSDFIDNYCNNKCWVYTEDWNYELCEYTVI